MTNDMYININRISKEKEICLLRFQRYISFIAHEIEQHSKQ